jgi:hypothetical protein
MLPSIANWNFLLLERLNFVVRCIHKHHTNCVWNQKAYQRRKDSLEFGAYWLNLVLLDDLDFCFIACRCLSVPTQYLWEREREREREKNPVPTTISESFTKKMGDLLTNWQQIVCKFSIVQATQSIWPWDFWPIQSEVELGRGGSMEERKGAEVGVSHWSCFATTTTVWGGPRIRSWKTKLKKFWFSSFWLLCSTSWFSI